MPTVVTRVLIDGVGIILLSEDGDQWKFVDWRERGMPISLRPCAEDCARSFASIEQAVEHFRERYAEELAARNAERRIDA